MRLPAARQLLLLLGLTVATVVPANWLPPVVSGLNPAVGIERARAKPAEITLVAGIKFQPPPDFGLFAALEALAPRDSALDRIALAVEAAESDGGADPLMWRSDPDGPQGPMQVSRAAAIDAGGGDRWDPSENRALGRAYLAKLYQRFGNWPDAIMAYNWGPGSLDLWIRNGRPTDGLVAEVAAYRERVMVDAGLEPDAADGVRLETARLPVSVQPIDPLQQAKVQEERIRDARLRQAFHANNETIQQLQAFLDAAANPEPGSPAAERGQAWLGAAGIDGEAISGGAAAAQFVEKAGAQLVLAIIRRVSGRPGYEVFDVLAKTKSSGLKLEVSQQIASLLLTKLQSENAMILVLDASKHARVSPSGSPRG